MTVPTEIPLPEGPRPKRAPAPAAPPLSDLALPAPLTVGSFFAEHRALVDDRKPLLARVGMTPEHAAALRMPDLSDRPLVAPVLSEHLPDAAPPEDFAPRKLPRLLGVNATLDDEA